MAGADIRWHQRFGNFWQALACLKEAVELSQQRSLSDLERQGLIKSFEFTHELSWKPSGISWSPAVCPTCLVPATPPVKPSPRG